jgi:hypothetical protein
VAKILVILFKGTVSRDFLLLVFFMNQFPPIPSIPLGQIRIFSKIHGDIRKSRCTTRINDTGFASVVKTSGKFATGGNLPPTSTTPAGGGKFPPVSLTPANNGNNIRLLRP